MYGGARSETEFAFVCVGEEGDDRLEGVTERLITTSVRLKPLEMGASEDGLMRYVQAGHDNGNVEVEDDVCRFRIDEDVEL